MRCAPTKGNGRIAEGDTPWLKFRVVDGVVEIWEPRDPTTPPNDKTVALAEARATVCQECDRVKLDADGSPRITMTINGRPVYTVKCKDCGCGGLSLVRGVCPLGKWESLS